MKNKNLKRLLALMLALVMTMAMLTGCITVNDSSSDSDDEDETKKTEATQPSGTSAPTTAPTTTPTTAPTGSGDPTTAPTTATEPSGEIATNPTGATLPSQPAQAGTVERILFEETVCEYKWVETGWNTGVLTVAEVMELTAEETPMLGLTGALKISTTILTFDVTYTKTSQDTYVVQGAVSSASAAVEGESAAAFIEIMKSIQDDTQLGKLTKRVLDGEVLTNKEDIENYIWVLDLSIKATFSVANDKLSMQEIEHNYVSWGFQTSTKDVLRVTNSVVREFEEYENGVLLSISYYRANSIIERTDYYYEGKVSSSTYYDEAGNPIQE